VAAVGHPRPPANASSAYTVDWLARAHRLITSREDAA
jgi:hypothetical protein